MSKNQVVTLPAGLVAPAICPKKSGRDLARGLARLAGESALASGKVKDADIFAFGLNLAIIGATDNNAAPLHRVKTLMGEKPSATQAARFQYWLACSSVGRAQFEAAAQNIDLAAILTHAEVSAYSPEGLKKAAEKAAADKIGKAEEAANKKRAAAVEAAAAAAEKARIEEAKKASDKAAEEAARLAFLHGGAMDNQAAAAEEARQIKAAEKAAAAAAEEAARLAWLERKAAEKAADIATNRAAAAAEFSALAEIIGIKFNKAQQAALSAFLNEAAAPLKVEKAAAA